jgi:hypothetical protein
MKPKRQIMPRQMPEDTRGPIKKFFDTHHGIIPLTYAVVSGIFVIVLAMQ